MFDEKEFQLNIENIKNDLAIEGMNITEHDINQLRMFANQEMAMPEMIQMMKQGK
ncbi:MAG: hypothetical protein IJ777_03850 [Clostridia bacterium]|nr:hypothetical protein [Clostridia bacterium]